MPGQKGASQAVAFLLVHRKKRLVIALEIKFKKTGRKMAGSLSGDAARLHKLSLDDISVQIDAGLAGKIKQRVDGVDLARAVLIVWHSTAIKDVIEQSLGPFVLPF